MYKEFYLLFPFSQVTAAEPILSVKRMVAKELDVPVHLQRLVFKGKTLAGRTCLKCKIHAIGPR